jgi:hypothetical protein
MVVQKAGNATGKPYRREWSPQVKKHPRNYSLDFNVKAREASLRFTGLTTGNFEVIPMVSPSEGMPSETV